MRCSSFIHLTLTLCASFVTCGLVWGDEPVAGQPLLERGKTVYGRLCAECHGAEGEGVSPAYPRPLIGDLSPEELTQRISETMPEDDPEACVGQDAQAVAAYIHQTFYSEAAQLRQRPPRMMLARLTANQLRQSLADLYTHFDGTTNYGLEPGVKGLYFDGPRFKNENKKIDRIDPVIDFDFGRESPGEGIEAKAFFIHWEGGIQALHTGRYEIIVRSTCSFIFDFGRMGRELVNNHVQSGDKTEFRRVVYLTAGRVYPFKIDFTQRERKTEQPPAKISLSWIPPHGVEEIIPARHLVRGPVPATFSLQTQLPPDDRSYGFDRGIAVSREWDDSTTAAALEFAQIAIDELWPQYRRRNNKDSDENRGRLRSFLTEVVSTAFRGPLDEATRQIYVDKQVDATDDDSEAIKRVVLITIKSPRFLYPLADQDRSVSQRIGNRLALTLFDSLPSDDWLLRQIGRDELRDEAQVREAARRMVRDVRARGKTREMLYEWLNLRFMGEITKDAERFPGFDAALVSDLRASCDAFLDEVVWSEASDYRQLFLADWAYTTDRMAAFYGDDWKPIEGPPGLRHSVPATAEAKARFGILTHPYLMSGLAYHDTTSPIHRGVFLIRHVLGRTLRPPNEAFTPLSPDLHPDLTTRERVALQTSAEDCQACHRRINGLGFTLENFDAVGRYRFTERDKPIDASGVYLDRGGQEVALNGPQALAEYLANSEEAQRAFVSRAFQHFVKQPAAAYGPETLDRLTEQFRTSGYNIRELLVEIAVVAALGDPALDTPTATAPQS